MLHGGLFWSMATHRMLALWTCNGSGNFPLSSDSVISQHSELLTNTCGQAYGAVCLARVTYPVLSIPWIMITDDCMGHVFTRFIFFFLLVCLLLIKKIVMAKLYAVVGGELLHWPHIASALECIKRRSEVFACTTCAWPDFTQCSSYRNKVPKDLLLRMPLVVKGCITVLAMSVFNRWENLALVGS